MADPLGYDPTAIKPPQMADPEFAGQRQRWLSRYIREHPDLYDYSDILEQAGEEADANQPVGGGGTQFQSPAERDAEFEKILNEHFRK